jgi:DNA-binding response OmpR family regulator
LKKIYLADDEKYIREIVTTFLENDGYEVRAFADGYSIRQAFDERISDMSILDIMMPGVDGLSLCSYFRKKSSVPIIIISAKDTPMDRVTGITLGSDDYLTKPFLPLELAVRVKALFRRMELLSDGKERKQQPVSCGNLCVIPKNRRITIDGELFKTTPTEYEFLFYLIQRQQSAVSKKGLLKDIWRYHEDINIEDTRVTDDLVKRLRKKLRERGSTAKIETIWGYGYQI